MIKIEHTNVSGFEAAIRGMRNPYNSWDKSDSVFIDYSFCDNPADYDLAMKCGGTAPIIKENDKTLMMKLRNTGTDHRKFMRFIQVSCDVTAPLYWWKEFDTYKVGTVANSCSTMHTIAAKEFTLDDFSHEHLSKYSEGVLNDLINALNSYRTTYIAKPEKFLWWQMIQLLPESYNQKRTLLISYEALANMYHGRKNHKLDEWLEFRNWIEKLPYSELITGGNADD